MTTQFENERLAIVKHAQQQASEMAAHRGLGKRFQEVNFIPEKIHYASTNHVGSHNQSGSNLLDLTLRFPFSLVPNGGAENFKGVLHGGSAAYYIATFGVCHVTALLIAQGASDPIAAVQGGTNLSLSFVSPVLPDVPMCVETRVLKLGGKMAFVQCDIVDEETGREVFVTAQLTVAFKRTKKSKL